MLLNISILSVQFSRRRQKFYKFLTITTLHLAGEGGGEDYSIKKYFLRNWTVAKPFLKLINTHK